MSTEWREASQRRSDRKAEARDVSQENNHCATATAPKTEVWRMKTNSSVQCTNIGGDEQPVRARIVKGHPKYRTDCPISLGIA